MLVVITFVSLSVCQVNDSFHQVELVQARLSPRGRALSRVIFDLLSFGFAALLLWQLVKFEISSYRFGEQRADLSGNAALDSAARDGDRRRRRCASPSCGRSRAHQALAPLARVRAARSAPVSPELQILIVTSCCFSACYGRNGGAVRDRGAGGHLSADAGRLHGAQQPRPDELGQHE